MVAKIKYGPLFKAMAFIFLMEICFFVFYSCFPSDSFIISFMFFPSGFELLAPLPPQKQGKMDETKKPINDNINITLAPTHNQNYDKNKNPNSSGQQDIDQNQNKIVKQPIDSYEDDEDMSNDESVIDLTPDNDDASDISDELLRQINENNKKAEQTKKKNADSYFGHKNIKKKKEKNNPRTIYNNENNYNQTKTSSSTEKHVFVSCFFPITTGPQRHPVRLYITRAHNLFRSFVAEMYIYTSSSGYKLLGLDKIKLNPNFHIILKYETPNDIPQIEKYFKRYKNIEKVMKKTEKYNITAEIGAIWNAKMIFLQEILDNMTINASYIHWIDIGLMKNNEYFIKGGRNFKWPSIERIEHVFGQHRDKIIFSSIPIKKRAYTKNSIILKNYERFMFAGCFGGPRYAYYHFLPTFWTLHDFFLEKEQYVLREELVFGSYCSLYPGHCLAFSLKDSDCRWAQSSVGYISKTNICNHINSVYTFKKTASRVIPVAQMLESWL